MSRSNTGVQDLPLKALRAFVAVGRNGTFSRAGTALGITQGAVSRHIAALEAFADARLFARRGASTEMTPAGLQLFEAVKDSMSTIELTMQLLAQKGQRHDRLRVRTSMPSFAMTVLVPSLGEFSASSGVQVDLITSLSPPQLSDDFDVLITRDLRLADAESWELVREDLVCVASPARVAEWQSRAMPLWPMIASRSRPELLASWALAMNLMPDNLQVAATYDHLFLAVTAAIGGTGFLIVPRLLVLDHLRCGSLQLAHEQVLSSGASYVAYVNAQSTHAQVAQDFCRWLKGMLRERR